MALSMHDEAPVIGAGGDEIVASGKERATRKWANMWRSIILSSLGKTLFPYAQYIRTLRFQDLESLLDDGTFVDKISKYVLEASHDPIATNVR